MIHIAPSYPPAVPSHQQFVHSTHSDKRTSSQSLDYDSATSSSDESETYAYEKFASDEHKFWQVHSSTTIISPPMTASDYAAISMSYVPKSIKRQQTPKKAVSLSTQVQQILGSTLDDVDEEIEQEWEASRAKLLGALIRVPKISLSSVRV